MPSARDPIAFDPQPWRILCHGGDGTARSPPLVLGRACPLDHSGEFPLDCHVDHGDTGQRPDDEQQGPAGVSGYEVVTGAFVMTLNVEYGTSTVECPEGKVPIGGGYDYSDLFTKGIAAKEKDFMGASYPTETG